MHLDTTVLPRALLERARGTARQAFCHAFRDTSFLVVCVEDPMGELSRGLESADTMTGSPLAPTRGALAYGTVVSSRKDLLEEALRESARPPFHAPRLRAILAKTAHFVVPLRKRAVAGKPFADRISVGRAHNNDVVLRHASVSKFHAWFECDDEQSFYVGDAHSRNKTLVNGGAVGSEMVQVASGDDVCFGDVKAMICPPDIFWDALAET